MGNNCGGMNTLPLYKELATSEEGKQWAVDVYKKARPGYHGLAQGTIDKVLYLQ